MDIVDKIFDNLAEAEQSLKRGQESILRLERAIGEFIEANIEFAKVLSKVLPGKN